MSICTNMLRAVNDIVHWTSLGQLVFFRSDYFRNLVSNFLEKGKYNPSLGLAHEVAKALKTTIDELFIFED